MMSTVEEPPFEQPLDAAPHPAIARPAMQRWMPLSLRGYQRSWLVTDIVAGVTLSAVAIPEVMG
jgi:hypothetical protein